MTAFLSRLRIAGFKSFAEPVSLDILPGLTGIVGPNGCGKSNVVEALRWAMGETSARSLRGGEMDDVIFAGTTARASRNLAEVTITLDGALPPPFEPSPSSRSPAASSAGPAPASASTAASTARVTCRRSTRTWPAARDPAAWSARAACPRW